MPRYDDRSGPTRLYVGHISRRTRSRDLEDIFSKYGRVRDVDMKHDFAFVDFGDSRDADDARHYLNGRTFDGSRIVVEFAKRGPRGEGGSRDYVGRGPAPGTGRCYNCGHDGHWARDCKAGDWKNKCYKCGQQGHIERNCNNSPRSRRSRSRSRSRSPVEARRRRSRSRSYTPRRHRYSRSPRRDSRRSPSPDTRRRSESRSRSRSPKRTRSRNPSHSPARRSRSHSPVRSPQKRVRSHSPIQRSPQRSRSRSQTDNGKNPERSRSVSPAHKEDQEGNHRDLSPSPPRDAGRSPGNYSDRDDGDDNGNNGRHGSRSRSPSRSRSRSASSSPQHDNGQLQEYVSPRAGNSPSHSGRNGDPSDE